MLQQPRGSTLVPLLAMPPEYHTAATGLGGLEDDIRAELDSMFAARELGLTNSRKVIRLAANAIRAIHRGERDRADELITESGRLLAEARRALDPHPQVLYAGFVQDAAKEYAEARLTIALTAGAALPGHRDLAVEVTAYLNGLGEAVGELRRRLLDELRAGRTGEAELTLAAMVEVLDLLASLDYPDGMTGGLRRTTDVARALIERSRADLTTTVVQERLRARLEEAAEG